MINMFLFLKFNEENESQYFAVVVVSNNYIY